MKRMFVVVFSTVLVALPFAACSGDGRDAAGGGGGDAEQVVSHGAEPAGGSAGKGMARGLAPATGDASADMTVTVEEYGGTSAARRPAGLPAIGPSVIKTAQVRIEVERDGFRDAVQDAIAAARTHGGFVISTRIDGEGSRSGSVVIRVPAERFERALDDVHALGEVEDELVSGQDVTEEFIDLEARLRHFQAQEAVLLDLMNRAVTVTDTIRVQHELQNIQLEIERLRGRLRFLRDQTDFSTIDVMLEESGAAPAPKNALTRAWDRARETFLAVVSGTIIAAGFVVPVAVMLGIAYLAFRALRPRFSSP